MAEPSRVLVTYASKMGATQEIAEAIGRQLQRSGAQITVAPCADNIASKGFDGVIIGSAIYTRRWLKTATRYLKLHADEFDPHRTWLFQSGPCGEGARSEQVSPPRAVARIIGRRGLLAPVTFGGRLDAEHATGRLSPWMAAEGPLAGDFRDWERIRARASTIADQLGRTTATRE